MRFIQYSGTNNCNVHKTDRSLILLNTIESTKFEYILCSIWHLQQITIDMILRLEDIAYLSLLGWTWDIYHDHFGKNDLDSTVDSSIHKQLEAVTETLVLKRHTISIYSAEKILILRD